MIKKHCPRCNKTKSIKNFNLRGKSAKGGRVRGLLCYMCNHTVARLGDDLESAERLVQYMKGNI